MRIGTFRRGLLVALPFTLAMSARADLAGAFSSALSAARSFRTRGLQQPPAASSWQQYDAQVAENNARMRQARHDLLELERLMARLDAGVRSRIEGLPKAARGSVRVAHAALREEYAEALAEQARLERQVHDFEAKAAQLRRDLASAAGRNQVLLVDLDGLAASAEDLERQVPRLKQALAHLERVVPDLEAAAANRVEEARRARHAYRVEVAGFFQRNDLGEPLDYAAPVLPPRATTQRGRSIRDQRVTARAPAAPAAPIQVRPALVYRASAVAAPRAVEAASPEAGRDLEETARKLGAVLAHHGQLRRRSQELMIESDVARSRLRKSLAEAARRETAKGRLAERRASVAQRVEALRLHAQDWAGRARTKLAEWKSSAYEECGWNAARRAFGAVFRRAEDAEKLQKHVRWFLNLGEEVLQKTVSSETVRAASHGAPGAFRDHVREQQTLVERQAEEWNEKVWGNDSRILRLLRGEAVKP